MDVRAERLERHLEHIDLMARTFAALDLQERDAIGDTLLSLTATFMSREHGVLLLSGERALVPVAWRGRCDMEAVTAAAPLWDSLAQDRVAQVLSVDALRARRPVGLPSCPRGLASVAITVRDHLLGLLVLAVGPDEPAFEEVELSFLTAAAGIGGLAISAADAVRHEGELARQIEKAAAAERRQAEEKGRVIVERDRQIAIIEQQSREILALSAPILDVGASVLAVPLIGSLDARRSAEIMVRLLDEVVQKQARCVLFDMTGVEDVDADMAAYFTRLVAAIALTGAEGIITGIRPRVAKTLVTLGVDLGRIRTLRSLRQGIDAARVIRPVSQ
jgi:anti-anti-sigma regulatory factor